MKGLFKPKERFRFHSATGSCIVELKEAVTFAQNFPKLRFLADFLYVIIR